MKNKIKLLPVAIIFLITTMLLSSCGIMKRNDFSTQKYTNFRKGKSTVNINQVNKEKKEIDLCSMVTDKKEVAETVTIAADKPSQTNAKSIPEIKNKSIKTLNHINIIPKETKKEKINHAASFIKDRLVNKPNTTSHDVAGLSLFWVVILVILILWLVGFSAGVGDLINLLLVIALVLLILWLLGIV